MHPAHNCHHIKSCHPPVKQYTMTHHNTEYRVIFYFKKSVPNIIIEGIPVEVVKHAKLLGVILSDDLTWNMHVDSIIKKLLKGYVVSAEESRYKTN